MDIKFCICKADGSEAILTDRAKFICDADGNSLHIVGTMPNVTERRMVSERLRQAQQLEAVG